MSAPSHGPHPGRTHLWVVLRHDGFHAPGTPAEAAVSATTAWVDEAAARNEAERLNRLRPDDDGVRYFVVIARLRDDG